MSNVENNFESQIAKPKKKWFQKWWIWVIVAFVFIIVMASNGDDTTTDKSSKPVSKTEQADTNKSDKQKETTKPKATVAPKNEVLQFFVGNQKNEAYTYAITDKAKEFLGSNAILFPTKAESAVTPFTDTSIGYKHLAKSIANYGDKLIHIPEAGVVDISENKVGDKIVTIINVMDETESQFIIYYLGSLSDVFEGDYISIYGLPLGLSSFANTDGGSTNVAVLAGSYVKKIQ
jgi:hypothetical protein